MENSEVGRGEGQQADMGTGAAQGGAAWTLPDSVPELEADQTIAPRPEEEIADALRAKPDLEDHSEHRVKTPPVGERNSLG